MRSSREREKMKMMPKAAQKKLKEVEIENRKELRLWLSKNHTQLESVWIVTYKKATVTKYVPYEAIVEEALCFGWIDSLPRSLDAERTMLRLSPRKPKSAWSRANKERAEKLIQQRKMRPEGLAKIKQAQANGSWNFLDDVQENILPKDLSTALTKAPLAKTHFDAFPPSSKRGILEWIKQAKKPETRLSRIRETVEKAKKNIPANHYRQPKKKDRT
jgi:uncharacterized protein YdeI (YjbR/CyaY-like superfamily)